MSSPILYETHLHTPLCKHAEGEPEDYALAAGARGLAGIIVTCHNPMPGGYAPSVRMELDQFEEYLRIVERARRSLEGQVDVRLGLECDWFPGYEGFLERQIASAPLEYVLGSVHPQLGVFQDRFFTGDAVEYQRRYFEQLAEAAESGLFDCISHPDLVKNVIPEAWDPERLLGTVRECLDRIARAGVAMELNTSGRNKAVPEFNPGPRILEEMRARDIPVVVGADAHTPQRVAEGFEDALDALEGAGYTAVSLVLGRRRREIPIREARASLREAP